MNSQNSKKILFNRSTLLNLKAELLKKQEEVQEKKRLPEYKIENFKPAPPKPADNNEKEIKKTFKDCLQEIDTEELAAYKKARAALEKKAELYEHLSNPAGDSQLANKFLVDFINKKQETVTKCTTGSELISKDNDNDDPTDLHLSDEDGDWTEFTDCLGRSRKCLKADLEHFKEKDFDLLKSLNKESDKEPAVEPREKIQKEKPFLVQKTNDYLQSLREKWEQKERELLAKDKDIHYQDVLFDEARMHGVSYFAFSTDEATRRKQMEELLKTREETLRAQLEAQERRRQQEDLVQARLKAARACQRMRAGLPPEDPDEKQKDFNACLLEFLNKQKEEAEARAKEQERKIKEEMEKERQKLRDAYVREWDRGKEGVDDKVKKFKELSQEEYVEQQRAKRIDEFAPPQSTSNSDSVYSFNDSGKKLSEKPLPVATWDSVRPRPKTPPPPVISDIEETKGLYFSTSKKSQPNLKYKNFVNATEPTPIENEFSGDDDDSGPSQQRSEKRKLDSQNVEVPPPPTYEYYGPVSKQSKFAKPFESDMREAFAQGTKSLESKGKKRDLSLQYDFTFE